MTRTLPGVLFEEMVDRAAMQPKMMDMSSEDMFTEDKRSSTLMAKMTA